ISACSGFRSVQPASATTAATAAILIPIELFIFGPLQKEAVVKTGRRVCTEYLFRGAHILRVANLTISRPDAATALLAMSVVGDRLHCSGICASKRLSAPVTQHACRAVAS